MSNNLRNEPSLEPFVDPVRGDEEEVPSKFQNHAINFNGNGAEYFKIWIVNLILSILTIGIYSAWAKVRTKRYFYGNTEIDGAVFDYHATPIMILKGRIVAVLLFILFTASGYFSPYAQGVLFLALALLAPWVIWNSIRFNAKVTSYRNVRFAFKGRPLKLYLLLILVPLSPALIAVLVAGVLYLVNPLQSTFLGGIVGIGIFAVYLMIPLVQQLVTSYYFGNHLYGQGTVKEKLSSGHYYITYLKLMLLSFLWLIPIGLLIAAIAAFSGASLTNVDPESLASGSIGAGIGFVVFIPIILMSVWSKAYLQARIRNYVFSKIKLADRIKFSSELKVKRLFWIYLSNLFLLIITLGFAYPWTKIRLAKYKLETISLLVWGDLDGFVTQMGDRRNALGEELGDAFDLDIGLGI